MRLCKLRDAMDRAENKMEEARRRFFLGPNGPGAREALEDWRRWGAELVRLRGEVLRFAEEAVA